MASRSATPSACRTTSAGISGGRIIRNKLWFYGALRYRDINRTVLGAYSEVPVDGDLDNIVTAKYVTQKYSYQANSAHRFIFFNLWEHLRENAKMDSQRSWEAREDKATAHPIFKWGWEGQFGNAIAANFQFGYAPHDSVAPFLNTGTPQEIGRENVDTGIIHGENVVSGEDSRHFLHQTKGAVTYYKSNWAGGNHEFKVGGEHARNKNFRSLSRKPVNYHLLYEGEQAGLSGIGSPFQIAFFNAAVYPDGRQNTTSFFARDSWTLGRRLTLNLGVRYAIRSRLRRSRPATPRAGPRPSSSPPRPSRGSTSTPGTASSRACMRRYDVSGDGKTVIKGGWGRYHHMRLLTPDVLNFVKNSIIYDIYQWRDTNRNNNYDAGEVNLDPHGPDFVQQTGMEFDDLPPNFVNNPDEKQPKTDELSISLERELIANFAIRVTGLYTRSADIFRVKSLLQPYESYSIPITRRDPGVDGRLGTGDDGNLITFYEYPEALTGSGELMNFNDPKAGPQTYKSLEIAGLKRLANRWSLMASYSATKKHKPLNAGLAVGAFDSFNTDHVVGHVQSQHRNLPGRQHLGLGCQAAGVLQLPARRAAVVELPSSERRSVRPAGALHGRRDHSVDHAERGGDRQPAPAERQPLDVPGREGDPDDGDAEAGDPPRPPQCVEREHGDPELPTLGTGLLEALDHPRAPSGGDQRDLYVLTSLDGVSAREGPVPKRMGPSATRKSEV